MKSLLLILSMCAIFAQVQAQKLEVQNDTIFVIEGENKQVIDSAKIANRLVFVNRKNQLFDRRLTELEAQAAKIWEQKSKNQDLLLYLLEVQKKYYQLKNKKQ